MKWYGGIEAGGTKFNCIIASDPGHILSECRIPTEDPQKTILQVASFFRETQSENSIKLESIGLGCFGPIGLNQHSPDYGLITSTPKLAWRNFDILGELKKVFTVPIAFDTDVNAAALGEGKWGAAKGCSNFVYVTIGTGIGGGVIIGGEPIHGIMHPEIGHMFIPHLQDDPFSGICPSHRDCLEGLASGPAVKARWEIGPESIPPDHPAWKLEAKYLGYMVANIVLTLSPQKIILGGGVMKIAGLLERVRKETVAILHGYIQKDELLHSIDDYILMPGLGDRAGVLGSIALAQSGS